MLKFICFCMIINFSFLFFLTRFIDIQINKVDPIMDERKQRFSGKPVAEQIIKYYRVNHIQKFSYSRPFTRKDPLIETENEFASLWLERTVLVTTYPLPGILRWFPVNSQLTEVTEISPLRNAIETMEKTNKNLRNSIILYSRDKMAPINPLSLILTGKFPKHFINFN